MEKKATIIDDHDDDVIDANTIMEEVVDVSESLANVRDAECTPVSEKVELSDAAIVLILVSGLMPRTNSSCGSVWEFPHVELLLNVYFQYALEDFGFTLSASKDAPTTSPLHVLAKGKACLYNVLQSVASTCQCKLTTWPCLLAGPKTYKFPTSQAYSRGCCC